MRNASISIMSLEVVYLMLSGQEAVRDMEACNWLQG